MSDSPISVDGVDISFGDIKITDEADLAVKVDGVMVRHKDIKIAEEADLTVRVVEYGYEDYSQENPMLPVMATDFQVRKDALKKASRYFAKMLGSNWREGKQKIIDLHEDTEIRTSALHVWFRILHGDEPSKETLEDITPGELFHICQAQEKYELQVDDARPWFSAWWDSHNPVSLRYARQLLLPCWKFQHTRAFAIVTKFVVYNAPGYITPYNPSPHTNLRMPDEVLRQLNKAKNGLKDTIRKKLRDPMEDVLSCCTSVCETEKFFEHQKQLMSKKIWPYDDTRPDKGIEELLKRIEDLDRINTAKNSKNTGQVNTADGETTDASLSVDCIYCRKLDRSLSEAVLETRKKFEGLCLQCMEASKAPDDDGYFCKERDETWDYECRREGLHHGEDTWFYSYVGKQPRKKRRSHWQCKWHKENYW